MTNTEEQELMKVTIALLIAAVTALGQWKLDDATADLTEALEYLNRINGRTIAP